MDSFLHDVRAAWRNVRGRQWRAALAVGLLALAVAVNTVVFSTADSFVFHRLPYPNADRLVQIRNRNPLFGNRGSEFLTAPVLAAWQRQTDVLFSVQGYLTKTLFLLGLPGTAAQRVAT